MDLAISIADGLAIDPDAPALEYGRVWTSWGALSAAAGRIRAALVDAGAAEGARIGVLLRNHVDLLPALLAIFTSRRCLASRNAVSPDGKLSEDIVDAAAPVLIAIGRDGDRPGPHDAAARTGAAVLAVDRGDVRRLCDADPSRWTNPDAPGIAIEMLSRGTTGKPKRIPLPLRGRISAYAVSTRRRTSLVEAMRQPIAVLR